MSWSVQKTFGKPVAVRLMVEAAFDQAAKSYAGKTEADDVLAAKASVCEWLAECNCSEAQGVIVEASGSRGEGWLTITISCSKIPMLLT